MKIDSCSFEADLVTQLFKLAYSPTDDGRLVTRHKVIRPQVCKGLLGLDDAVQHDRHAVRYRHRRPVGPNAACQAAILRPQVRLGTGRTAGRFHQGRTQRRVALAFLWSDCACSCRHCGCCQDTHPTATPSDPASGSDPCPSPSPPRPPPPSADQYRESCPRPARRRHAVRRAGPPRRRASQSRLPGPQGAATASPEGNAGALP